MMRRPSRAPRGLTPTLLALWLAAAACTAPPPPTARPDPTGGGTTGAGGGGGSTPPFHGDGACAVLRGEVTFERRPVDVVLVVDNSSSMTNEIRAVEHNINVNFARIIEQSGLDYRIILLSKHGDAATDQSVCITAPLSGHASCSPLPSRPANTARFFHYDKEVLDSTIYTQILETYRQPDPDGQAPAGWSAWLRPAAFKTFIVLTDEDELDKETRLPVDEREFDNRLMQLDPASFGDDDRRGYVWHSIVGVAANSPATTPWLPGDPVQAARCTAPDGETAPLAGESYQRLSRRTGGLRYPICAYQGYDAVFNQIAQRVVRSGRVACEFDVPPPPDGRVLDLGKIAVAYTRASGSTTYYRQAATRAACVPDAFYVENGRVLLCPDACASVQADDGAQLEVLFTCESTVL